MPRLRILHVHRNLKLAKGGVVRFVIDLAQALAREHEVMVVSPDVSDVPDEWKRELAPRESSAGGASRTPRCVAMDSPSLPMDVLSAGAIANVLPLIEWCDVAHFHGAWMPMNIQLAAQCRRLGKAYVASPHGMLDDWCMNQARLKKRIFHALAGAKFFAGAARVHCTAQAELDQSSAWFPKSLGVVIPPLVDLAAYRALPGAELWRRERMRSATAESPIVLFLSRLHPKKRPDILIEAAAMLRDRGVRASFVLAGPGDEAYVASLRERARAMKVEDRVEFPGLVTGEMKLSLYQAASVFALPTSQENFGLVLAEAMACGTPVVTTRGVDIWPELESSGGAIVTEASASTFAGAIAMLLSDASKRHAMSVAARSHVFSWLDEASVLSRYVEMYTRAAGK
ncbi:MAG: glycosyltransferase [Phycisphaerales bacterium]|nr:glycosyltransferase [Phycisphaerales bacterium]